METTKESSTELIIEAEEAYGWITDNQGSRYREDDGSFAKDSWKIWEDKLYYLKEGGFMATEEIKKDGQIFIFAFRWGFNRYPAGFSMGRFDWGK